RAARNRLPMAPISCPEAERRQAYGNKGATQTTRPASERSFAGLGRSTAVGDAVAHRSSGSTVRQHFHTAASKGVLPTAELSGAVLDADQYGQPEAALDRFRR